MQSNVSNQNVSAIDGWREASENLAERTFLAVYGSQTLQAAVGIDTAETQRLRKAPKNPLHGELLQKRIDELKSRIPVGGARAAVVRALIYVAMNRRSIDERGFEMASRLREAHSDMSVADFKALVREQFNILSIDQEAALAAIPSMLPPDADTREKAYGLIKQLMSARGELSTEDKERMNEIARLFGLGSSAPPRLREVTKKPQAKASCSCCLSSSAHETESRSNMRASACLSVVAGRFKVRSRRSVVSRPSHSGFRASPASPETR